MRLAGGDSSLMAEVPQGYSIVVDFEVVLAVTLDHEELLHHVVEDLRLLRERKLLVVDSEDLRDAHLTGYRHLMLERMNEDLNCHQPFFLNVEGNQALELCLF